MFARHLPSRAALTLTELLVVLAIIGILLALLLPAVMRVREASARAVCHNNLRQLGLATHAFHDARERLPFGQFQGPYGDGPDSYAWSWLAENLPFLEQTNLYQQGGIPFRTLVASGIIADTVPVFFCPSDMAVTQKVTTKAGNLFKFPVGLTNYKGVSGSNWGVDYWDGNLVILQTDWPHQGANGSYDGLADGDGMLYRSDSFRPLRLTDITDGKSNTFMIGEDVPALNDWCSWPYSNNAYGTCAIPPNVRPPGGGQYDPYDWQNS
jgi:prepilin-type N-terminal cleavage/methylation domain-containing protein